MLIGIDASRASIEKKTGVEYYSYFLIQELKKIILPSHKVVLYSREPLRSDLAILPDNWQSKIIKSPAVIPFRGKKPFLWTQLGLTIEMLRRPPDILFIPSHALPFIHPKNSVVTIHDLGFEIFSESYHPFARAYHRFVAKFAVRYARKIIAISQFTKNELVDLYNANPEKIVVIQNAYDASKFNHTLDEAKKKEVLKKYNLAGELYLFYIGRLEKKKNLVTLIKAFNILNSKFSARGRPALGGQIPDSRFSLVLAGSPAFGFDEIQKTINESPARDRIKMLNYIPSEDATYLISGAAVFIFPSAYEGFGMPILEAMAVGTPVVASDIQPLREVGGDSALFADPKNPEDFAKKIAEVLENKVLHETLISRGLEQVKRYSWQNTAKKIFDVLSTP